MTDLLGEEDPAKTTFDLAAWALEKQRELALALLAQAFAPDAEIQSMSAALAVDKPHAKISKDAFSLPQECKVRNAK